MIPFHIRALCFKQVQSRWNIYVRWNVINQGGYFGSVFINVYDRVHLLNLK